MRHWKNLSHDFPSLSYPIISVMVCLGAQLSLHPSSVDCSTYHSTQRLAHGTGVGKYLCSLLFFQIALPSFSSALPVVSCLHQTEWLAGPLGDAQTPHHSLLFLEGFSSRISVPFSHATSRMTLEGFTTPSNGCSNLSSPRPIPPMTVSVSCIDMVLVLSVTAVALINQLRKETYRRRDLFWHMVLANTVNHGRKDVVVGA